MTARASTRAFRVARERMRLLILDVLSIAAVFPAIELSTASTERLGRSAARVALVLGSGMLAAWGARRVFGRVLL